MKKLIVVYDKGAVNPLDAYTGLSAIAQPVFAVAPSEHGERVLNVVERLGETVVLGSSASESADRLRGFTPAGIVTFSEDMVEPTAELARHLGLPYHQEPTLGCLKDKHLQRLRLRERGVDATVTRRIRTRADVAAAMAAIDAPVILKPARGGASRDTHVITAPDQGAQLVDAILDRYLPAGLVIEELLGGRWMPAGVGDYISIESAVVDGRITHLAVTGKFALAAPFREVGQFWPALLDEDVRRASLDLATAGLTALDVRQGVTHTEIKLTPDGPRIIEINGRLGGHIHELAQRTGVPSPIEIAGTIALGEDPAPSMFSPPPGVYWQYNTPAPRRPARLAANAHGATVTALEGVSQYTPYYQKGDPLDLNVMTNPLDVISGHSKTHEEMLQQVDRLLDHVVYRLDMDGTEFAVAARELVAI
ncbi:ATP-grasp domain-containing protein [Streptomyces sp. HC307]|uniref:ATP-grasp domain-containing protein n=1 Tax=Streptomyces flavusporus TaxID=3385496 RepID=UPI0039170A11